MPLDPRTLVRPEVLQLAPYNAGLTIEALQRRHQVERVAKLASGENPLGHSPRVSALLRGGLDLATLYPDPHCVRLREALATRVDVDAARIVCGNGSEDLIEIVCRTFVRAADRVVTLYPSFPLHETYTLAMGGTIERVHVREDLSIDTEALIAAVRAPARVLMFSNPMNPVGAMLSSDDLARVCRAAPQDTLIVIDEAYYEYVDNPGYPDSLRLLGEVRQPWVVLRTFSKAYGLAGLRVGYAIASDAALVSFFDRVRTPFNVNTVAQEAARVALEDQAHVRASAAHNIAERTRVARALDAMGLRAGPSQANFLFFDTGRASAAVFEALLEHGVIVKSWHQPGFETYVRAGIGSREDNDQLLQALPATLHR